MSDHPLEPTAKDVAERYVERELAGGRDSLKRTQILSSVLTTGICGFLLYLTAGYRSNLEPHAAAEIATGLASQRVDEIEPQFASYLREEAPKAIRHVPDELIKRMPEYRENLEKRVEDDLRAHSADASKRLSETLMAFLAEHKTQVGEMLLSADDPAAIEAMGKGLEARFRSFLREEPVGGSTIQAKLDETLSALKLVEKRTARLATNQGLTPSERKARRAVAMLMQRIDDAKADSPSLPTLRPSDLHEAVNRLHEAGTRVIEISATSANPRPESVRTSARS